MDAQIEMAQVVEIPDWMIKVMNDLRPFISTATNFVHTGEDESVFGASETDRWYVVHIHNAASIKTLEPIKTDGTIDPTYKKTSRTRNGESTRRRILDYSYILIDNGIKKDGVNKIEQFLYVKDHLLFRKLREMVGLR